MIARTSAGKRLIEALRDEHLQQIAWEQHGFRSGLIGVQNDPAVLKLANIRAEISWVMPLPRTDAMIDMLDYLRSDSS